MDFSLKNVLVIIATLFFAFTLYWFVQFGTVFWFLSSVGDDISNSSIDYREQIKISNERIKSERALSQLKKEQAYKERIFISSGDHSKKVAYKEELCNKAIFRAMADKSDEAKENKKVLCEGI